jgi:hypothetical protein
MLAVDFIFFLCYQYVLVKFVEPRQESYNRLGVVGVKFFGFVKNQLFSEDDNKVGDVAAYRLDREN